MNSGLRILHDAVSRVREFIAGPPTMVDSPPGELLLDSGIIQQSGECSLANTLESALHVHEEPEIRYQWNEARYFRLKRALLVGDNGQIFLPDGRFFLGCLHPQQHLVHRMKIRRPISLGARHIKGPVFHLTGRNHENRGHFLLQHLPRLLAARELLESIGDYRILVAPGHARWQKALLKTMGFDPERVIEGSRGTMVVDDLIHVPLLYGSNALSSPDLCRAIRDQAARACPETTTGRPLFISRADAPDKKLENEAEVIAAAEKVFGEMEVFVFKGKTLADQIRIYRNAPLIMGPIGQGICNILFAEGRPLITLVPGEEGKHTYTNSHSTHLALVCGNPAVTLYNGVASASRGNWSFPVDRFSAEIDRLVAHPLMKPFDRRPERQSVG